MAKIPEAVQFIVELQKHVVISSFHLQQYNTVYTNILNLEDTVSKVQTEKMC